MAARATSYHLGFGETADLENPTVEPNMKWIGRPFAEIWSFEIFPNESLERSPVAGLMSRPLAAGCSSGVTTGERGGGQLPPGAAGKGAQNRGRKIASSTRPQKFDAI